MQISDASHSILVEKWRLDLTLHADGIFFPSGLVTLIDAKTVRRGSEIQCVATPLADTSITSLLQYNSDAWVEITRLAIAAWSETIDLVCGEGAMGNEGFIAAVESAENRPLWIFFSTRSNPFTALHREGEHVLAEAGYGQLWRVPFSNPAGFSIERDPDLS